jgi:GTPase SAR1 family protein
LIVAAVTAVVGIAVWSIIAAILDKKKLAVIGFQTSGKTSFVHFLKYKKLPEQYRQTMRTGIEKVIIEIKSSSFTCKIFDSETHIKGNDYKSEIELIKDCDYILYFFKVNDILEENESVHRDILDQTGLIAKFIDKNKHKKIIAVGTHCDLLKGVNEQQIKENKRVQELEHTLRTTGIYNGLILGALNTEKGAKAIIDEFAKLLENGK